MSYSKIGLDWRFWGKNNKDGGYFPAPKTIYVCIAHFNRLLVWKVPPVTPAGFLFLVAGIAES
jgi:hypothetical protein